MVLSRALFFHNLGHFVVFATVSAHPLSLCNFPVKTEMDFRDRHEKKKFITILANVRNFWREYNVCRNLNQMSKIFRKKSLTFSIWWENSQTLFRSHTSFSVSQKVSKLIQKSMTEKLANKWIRAKLVK